MIELAIVAVIILLWQFPITLPFKFLVVFFHELSHAVAVWITGGSVIEFSININQGGHVLSQGGNRFITLSAGYLGSLLWGLLFFYCARLTKLDKIFVFMLGSVMVLVSLVYGWNSFLLWFGLGAGAIFIAISYFLPAIASDVLLRVIGLISMVGVPLDILSDTIVRSHLKSDAAMLGEEYFGGAVFWGGIWLMISVVLIIYVLYQSIKSAKI